MSEACSDTQALAAALMLHSAALLMTASHIANAISRRRCISGAADQLDQLSGSRDLRFITVRHESHAKTLALYQRGLELDRGSRIQTDGFPVFLGLNVRRLSEQRRRPQHPFIFVATVTKRQFSSTCGFQQGGGVSVRPINVFESEAQKQISQSLRRCNLIRPDNGIPVSVSTNNKWWTYNSVDRVLRVWRC